MDLTKVLKPYNVLSEKTIDKYIIQLQLNTQNTQRHISLGQCVFLLCQELLKLLRIIKNIKIKDRLEKIGCQISQ